MTRSESEPSPASTVDEATAVRPGEDLDLERLRPYLLEHIPGARDGDVLQVEQFPSGYSNLTYLLRLGELELVLRRPPFGNRVATAHDMAREHRVLSALADHYPLAPRPLLLCEDDAVLGAPFYVMERREGVILRRRLPAGLELPPVLAARLSQHFVDELAALHSVDVDAAGLTDLGKPEGYVERQVRGWVGRYEASQTHTWRPFDEAGAWLIDQLDTLPKGRPATLIHNDYKYDNLLLDPHDLTRVVGVLDWEMATLGDPAMDLGTTLAYWVEAGDPAPLRQAAFGPTALPGSWTRGQIVERWSERTGLRLEEPLPFYVFGLYKLGVIVQQIYARWARGHTRDERFAGLHEMVGLLGQVAAGAIDRERI